MNNKNEYLYTDIAVQMMSTFFNDDNGYETTVELFKSLEKEKEDNPLYMGGLIHGLMIHFQILFRSVSEMTGKTDLEVFQEYVLFYNLIRDNFEDRKALSPSWSKEFFNSLKFREN